MIVKMYAVFDGYDRMESIPYWNKKDAVKHRNKYKDINPDGYVRPVWITDKEPKEDVAPALKWDEKRQGYLCPECSGDGITEPKE